MAFCLTIIYIVLTFLSPDELIPALVSYRPLIWLAAVIGIVSIPQIANSYITLKLRYFWLAAAFTTVVVFSNAVHLWFGGALIAIQQFLPNAIVFFLVLLHVNTISRLRILAATTLSLAIILATQGIAAYHFGFGGTRFLITENLFHGEVVVGEIRRIRAEGFLNDPNDLAQFFEVALPLSWLLWRRHRLIHNLVFVLVPTAYLSYATFLTHSRGALLGLAVVVLFTLRSKMGSISSAIITAAGVLGALALNFTGGRDISAASGADRLDSWSAGLQMFKSNPLFGVGYGRYTDFNNITAHNSFVLCLAELGIIGAWLWVAMLLTTFLGLMRYIVNTRNHAHEEPVPAVVIGSLIGALGPATAAIRRYAFAAPSTSANLAERHTNTAGDSATASMAQWARVLQVSLLGFLVTAWFLSRAYATTFFLVLGLASSYLAIRRLNDPDGDRPERWVHATTLIVTAAIVLVYVSVRLGQ